MMSKKCIDITVAAALLVYAQSVLSDEKNRNGSEEGARLQEVVVTATKSEKNLSEAPATVSVVSANDIEAKNIHSPDEALKFLPGVYATRPGGHQSSVMSTNVVLRGIPDYSRTLVLVDGQTLNDPYIGAVTWESVAPEIIDRIEVVPGPFSSLYGGSAMGGVINIITKAPTKQEVLAKAGYGTDGLKSGTFVYQNRLGDRAGVIFDLAVKGSGGYATDDVVKTANSGSAGTAVTGWQATTDPYGNHNYLIGDKGKSPWESRNLGLKLMFDLPNESKLSLAASRFEYDKQWDRFHTYLQDASGNPVSSGNVTFNDSGNKTISLAESSFLAGPNPKIQNRYSLQYDAPLWKGTMLKTELHYTDIPLYDYVIPLSGATYDGGGPSSRLHRPNSEVGGSLQLSLPVAEQHFLVAGVSGGKRKIETYQYAISDWRNVDETGTTQNRTAGEDKSYALFVQDEIYLTDRLTAYLGGRYDSWSTKGYIEQVKAPAYKNDYSSRSQDHFSPKASAVYLADNKTTFRASIGNAFHVPNLRDTFGWWTPSTGKTYVPNPDLKPETVTSWEAGVEKQAGDGTLLRATYYENRLKNLIYRTEDATTQSVTNAGAALIKGIELELRQKINSNLNVFVNLTYSDAKITENPAKPSTEGKRMTQTPQTMFNAGLQGSQGLWSYSMAGHYVGKVYANDVNADIVNNIYGSYDPYFVVDAKLSYKVKDGVTASLSADNLLDRDYYQSGRAQGRAFFGEIAFRF